VAGELLLVAIAMENNGAGPSTPAGWTARISPVTVGTLIFALYERVATGGETSVTISHGNNETVWMAWRIGANSGSSSAGSASGTDTAPNPPSLAPGSAKQYTWIAMEAHRGNGATSAYPTGYDQGQQTVASTGGNFSRLSSAERFLTAASDDPAAFTIASSANWVAATVAVSL
jgi:hypothetical protein